MGGGCGSWFPQQQFDWQSCNWNSSNSPMHLGQHNVMSPVTNPGTNRVSPNETLPVSGYLGLPHSQVIQTNENHGWFYCLPHFRPAFTPAVNFILKEHQPPSPCGNFEETIKPKASSGCAQKKFLVFDQSGDQTTLIFSSGIGNPIKGLASCNPKPPGANNLAKEDPGFIRDANLGSVPNSIEDSDGTDLQSEMHEDTEELNALLYSDDDGDYTDDDGDDEVTSTGHSPSTMTAHEKLDWFEGSGTEEVASSAGPTKKRKLFDRDYDDGPLLMPAASSVKYYSHPDSEDDAESSCANSQNARCGELHSLSGNKRMRSEKIRETVSALRSIIPGGKSKDAMVVIDEAIDYLKSLKLKAKALGLDNGL